MSATLEALVPVFLLILLGFGFRRANFPGNALWVPVERLTYFVLFPALLLRSLWAASPGGLAVDRLAIAFVLPIVAMSALLLALRSRLNLDGPAFSSLFQGSIRFNTYVGLAVALALYRIEGLTAAAISLAILIPLVNVLSVAVLTRVASTRARGWKDLGAALVRNPLILACVAGALLDAAGAPMPGPVNATLEVIGRAALPIGLLAVGAGLQTHALRGGRRAVVLASALKLLALPGLAWIACSALDVTGLSRAIVVLFCALPGAPASYVLAGQLGGDRGLMAGILTAQTALAAITLPIILTYLK